MKVKCVKNTVNTGIFFKKEIDLDLTIGKIYKVQAVPIVNAVLNGTSIELEDIDFLLFDDKGIWKAYDKELFEPTEW